jgi:hypothetical protein
MNVPGYGTFDFGDRGQNILEIYDSFGESLVRVYRAKFREVKIPLQVLADLRTDSKYRNLLLPEKPEAPETTEVIPPTTVQPVEEVIQPVQQPETTDIPPLRFKGEVVPVTVVDSAEGAAILARALGGAVPTVNKPNVKPVVKRRGRPPRKGK